MDTVGLPARYGRVVTVDVCDGCGGLWFDHGESQQMSPGATLRLLDRLRLKPTRALNGRSPCPRCRLTLLDVQDQQRATRFAYRRCSSGHGRFITAYHFLREKHLVRELTAPEIAEVRARVQQINCVNCGAPVDLSGPLACAHCATPVSMVDPDHLRRELETLQRAESRVGQIDPTLPVRLLQERAAAERDWTRLSDSATIVEAVVRLLG